MEVKEIKQFVVRLSDEEHEKLREISFKEQVSMQQIFYKLVKEYLNEHAIPQITLSTSTDRRDPTVEELPEALNTIGNAMKELGAAILKLQKKE